MNPTRVAALSRKPHFHSGEGVLPAVFTPGRVMGCRRQRARIESAALTRGAALGWLRTFPESILRQPTWDALFIVLALVHGALLLAAPSIVLIALGLWWNSNTIAHNFIHLPFFRARAANAFFSAYLSLVLGIPQRLWRDRHLAHHADRPWRWHWSPQLGVETLLVGSLWTVLPALAPGFLLKVYLPGWLIGLGLCHLQGYYEHARGTRSHYGWLYNLLFFNDGYHVEHHERPATHWSTLPCRRRGDTRPSRWPAALRWLEVLSLDSLERLVLRSCVLQRFVLHVHERAFRKLLPQLPPVRSVGIVGGGLFPRTALILKRLLPDAQLHLIDSDADHLRVARGFVNGETRFEHRWFDGADRSHFDLMIIPLAYHGDRGRIYREPPAPIVLVHDWIWRRHGPGAVVSLALGKRLNLVARPGKLAVGLER